MLDMPTKGFCQWLTAGGTMTRETFLMVFVR
jgi:hypothetical protein